IGKAPGAGESNHAPNSCVSHRAAAKWGVYNRWVSNRSLDLFLAFHQSSKSLVNNLQGATVIATLLGCLGARLLGARLLVVELRRQSEMSARLVVLAESRCSLLGCLWCSFGGSRR